MTKHHDYCGADDYGDDDNDYDDENDDYVGDDCGRQ